MHKEVAQKENIEALRELAKVNQEISHLLILKIDLYFRMVLIQSVRKYLNWFNVGLMVLVRRNNMVMETYIIFCDTSWCLGQQHKIFTDTYNLMKLENYRFPSLKESEAMFENDDVAPEWRDDKECFRCRQVFTTFIRKVIRP